MRNLLLAVTLAAATAAAQARDSDGDSVPDATDDCPCEPDPDQLDADHDGLGDACDPAPAAALVPPAPLDPSIDTDQDGLDDDVDNCREVKNPSQADADADGIGDACDVCVCTANPRGDDGKPPDRDGDGVPDACDVCPLVSDPAQPLGADGFPKSCDGGFAAAWKKFKQVPRGKTMFFMRPLVAAWWRTDAAASDVVTITAVYLYAQNSIDAWQFHPRDVAGAVPVSEAIPPSWWWRAGLVFALADSFTAGVKLGIDLRPIGNEGFGLSFFRYFTFGLSAHAWFHGKLDAVKDSTRFDLGFGPRIALFDALAVEGLFQGELIGKPGFAAGVLVSFELKVLEELGVKERIPLLK